jgi:demethylmenaquinone methyltransferase/2-methoxy-6-polyprenyl-1,4-benzoquinol methylase
MFDKLAVDYDLMNNIISFGMHKFIKKQVIKNVRIRTGAKILDVCTGTGDIPMFIAEKYGDSVKITGVDFSEKMLEVAKKRNANYKNIEFLNADALNLPFEDNSFDAVFISFGLRNLDDLRKGIIELQRVTKKNGYVVNLDVGKPKGILGYIFRLYFLGLVPFLGKLFHGNSEPYVYLPESCESFPDQEELVRIFYELGFEDVKNYNFAFGAMAQQVARV